MEDLIRRYGKLSPQQPCPLLTAFIHSHPSHTALIVPFHVRYRVTIRHRNYQQDLIQSDQLLAIIMMMQVPRLRSPHPFLSQFKSSSNLFAPSPQRFKSVPIHIPGGEYERMWSTLCCSVVESLTQSSFSFTVTIQWDNHQLSYSIKIHMKVHENSKSVLHVIKQSSRGKY